MDALYYASLKSTWFHRYLSGHYFSRSGKPFLLVKIEDIPNDNVIAVEKRDAAIKEYQDLYQQKVMTPIRKFLTSFFKTNNYTLFYHLYWMGHVCDSNGVPFYLKCKKQFEYSKSYQNQNKKNEESFEKYMKKQKDKKEKKARAKKQQKTRQRKKKSKLKQSEKGINQSKYRIRDDSGATYLGGKPNKQAPKKNKIPKQPVSPNRRLQQKMQNKSDDPDAFINPKNKVSTRLTKNRKFRKRKSLKSKMRQLKMEMANLL